MDLEIKKSKEVSPEVYKEIKWNKEGEDKLCEVYKIGSKATSKRQQKFAPELDKQAKQIYNIRAL